jgi:hypothetical protein
VSAYKTYRLACDAKGCDNQFSARIEHDSNIGMVRVVRSRAHYNGWRSPFIEGEPDASGLRRNGNTFDYCPEHAGEERASARSDDE